MKTCAGCKISKPETDFGQHLRTKDGLRARCRQCEQKPPRTATCAACGEGFSYKRRGPAAHVCESCTGTHHWCHRCETAKPRSEFYRQSTAAQKISYRCKACALEQGRADPGVRSRKAAAVKHRYGISLDQYESLLSAPEGTCPCCQRSGRRSMVLDHDHQTGKIRGVICSGCNTGIGSLGDSIEGLRKALAYLESTNT